MLASLSLVPVGADLTTYSGPSADCRCRASEIYVRIESMFQFMWRVASLWSLQNPVVLELHQRFLGANHLELV